MTRGRFVLITTDEDGERHYYTSTEFNGGMGVHDRDDVLYFYTSEHIHNVEEWGKYVDSFNERKFQYRNEWIHGEITDGSELYETDNLYDLTSCHGLPDYSYWLNLGEDDIEVIACPGIIVSIPSMGGAVFNFDLFYSTTWKSSVIPANESKDFKRKAMVYEEVKNGNLNKKEAEEWFLFDTSGRYQIETVYSCMEDLGEDLLINHLSSYAIPVDVAEMLKYNVFDDCFDYGKYAKQFLNQDGYFELSSGKVIKYYVEE